MEFLDEQFMAMVVADVRGEATVEISAWLRSEETVHLWASALEVKLREAKECLEAKREAYQQRLLVASASEERGLRDEQLTWESRHRRYARCLKDRLSEARGLTASYHEVRSRQEKLDRDERRRRHETRVDTEGRLTALRRAIDVHRDAILATNLDPREADLELWDALDDNWGLKAWQEDRAARC